MEFPQFWLQPQSPLHMTFEYTLWSKTGLYWINGLETVSWMQRGVPCGFLMKGDVEWMFLSSRYNSPLCMLSHGPEINTELANEPYLRLNPIEYHRIRSSWSALKAQFCGLVWSRWIASRPTSVVDGCRRRPPAIRPDASPK
jgi:hypothetical protein